MGSEGNRCHPGPALDNIPADLSHSDLLSLPGQSCGCAVKKNVGQKNLLLPKKERILNLLTFNNEQVI